MRLRVNMNAMRRVFILALLLPFSAAMAAQTSDSPAVSKLMKHAKTHAAAAYDNALNLESYWRIGKTWHGHDTCLREISDELKMMDEDLSRLNAIRKEGSPQQQEAIDSLNLVLISARDQLAATVRYLRTHLEQVQMPPYRELIHTSRLSIERTHAMFEGSASSHGQ